MIDIIDTLTASAFLMFLVALWMHKARQAYTAFRGDEEQSGRAQSQALRSVELEAEIEQRTEQYNHRSWRKLTMSCAGLALFTLSVAFLSRFIDRSGPETSDQSGSIFIATAALSVFVLKADFPADKLKELTSHGLIASLTTLLRLILRIILFGVAFNLFVGTYYTVRYGYLKSVRAVERPSQITRSDVGVDFYLIKALQRPPSGATLYHYNSYRGLEVTALYPLHDAESPSHDAESPSHDAESPSHDAESPSHNAESHDRVYLTKVYQVLNNDRPQPQINQDILNDLNTYTHHQVCLSRVPEHRAPSSVGEIFRRSEVQRSHENTVILEPAHKGGRGGMSDQIGPTPNTRQQETSACEAITAQDSITHLFTLVILGALIIWLFQQTLMCRKIVLTYLTYHKP